MSATPVSACIVVLNQQREQTIRHCEACERETIAPAKALTSHCTVVENGQVVVKPNLLKVTQSPDDTVSAS